MTFFFLRPFVKAVGSCVRPPMITTTTEMMSPELRGKRAIWLCYEARPLGIARGQWQELLNVPRSQCPKHSDHRDGQAVRSC